ncbi:MAG TPA: FliM/FliN family flagellar motor C-terminal domain-containing protein [Terriglobales bacterium]|nr:FliM/FliN family flagellar motor C-terminal domain-containing protein [Terriglobales bacterium]
MALAEPTRLQAINSPPQEDEWGELVHLPCTLSLDLPVPDIRVRELIELDVDSILDTKWLQSRDVPVRVNGTFIGWAEFEVVGNRLAVRITELAGGEQP